MKALVMTRPGEFVLEERARPIPAEGEALFAVLSVGVCGTDLHAYQGNQPFFSYPRVVGHELAVRAVEIPAGARGRAAAVKEGDVVSLLPYLYCGVCAACASGKPNCCERIKVLGVHTDGGLREYLSFPLDYAVPAAVKPADLALVECFAIGFHGVRRAGPREGEAALVVGAGPIGVGVIHGLKERGAKVIVMDINEKRLAYARDTAAADYIINAREAESEKTLRDILGGELPPLVMDATGNAGQMMKAPAYAGAGGSVVFVGLVRDNLVFHDPLLHAKELTLMASRNATKEDFRAVIAALENGRINTRGFITHTANLEEAPAGFAAWTKAETGCIKAVIEIAKD